MNKIINVKKSIEVSKKLKQDGKSVVVVGGCFDILHPGHVLFLEKAKKAGDVLFVLLESDEAISQKKGEQRPIHTQKDRSLVLANLVSVDYVVILPLLKTDRDYDDLLSKLKPTIIATTKGDPNRYHKVRQANLVGARVINVVKRIENTSTSSLAKL